MTQKGGMNEAKGIGSKESNTGNVLNDEIIEELRKINQKLDVLDKKIEKITPGTYTRSWRDYEK